MKTMKLTALLTALILVIGCGGGESKSSKSTIPKAENNGLSAFELEHGIGPITEEVTISEFNAGMVEKGENIFVMNCSACHKIDERYIGPAIADVIERRTPTYMMNMMLNPDEMVKKHPEAKKVLAEFLAPMPNQNLTTEDARAVVEYLVSLKK